MTDLSPELAEALETARAAYERAVNSGGLVPPTEDDTDEPSVERRGVDALVCVYCHDPIPSVRLAYRKVVGWERQRKAGGTNAVRLRQPTDDYACRTCVDSISSGRDPAQGTML